MSQHDYVINNDSGASVRADINSALQAILSTNSGTSAPTSTSAGTLWLDTTGGAPYTLKIRDAGNNHWLTLASVTDPGSDGNIETSATIKGTIDSTASGTLGNNINFPAGIALQATFEQQRETNALTTSYVNYHEFSITLKSSSSDIFGILSFSVQFGGANNGYAIQLYRKSSSGVTTSDTLVYDPSPFDGTGALIGYQDSYTYDQHTYNFKDTLSGFSVGDTIYYGIFFKKRNTSNSLLIPVSEPTQTNGVFDITLFEVQK